MPALSPEFRLVCACCRWPPSPQRDAAIRAAAQDETIDWERVRAIVERHRVQGLVARGLTSAEIVPPLPALIEAGLALVRSNLKAAGEYHRLYAALQAAGIDAIFVKGLPTAIQAYGTLAVKASIDIDLLVEERAIASAAALLTSLGYRRTVPGPEIADDQLSEWVRWFKESSWHHPALRLQVDLHGRLVSNPALAPQIGLGSPREQVRLGGSATVPTLDRQTLYSYLCVHGAETGWSRLKWIADLGALLGASTPEEIARLHAHAERLGVGRCSAQGLLLCHALLDLELGKPLHRKLARPRVHRWLVQAALSAITGRYEVDPHRHDSRDGARILASHFFLRAGLRHKWAELSQKLANPKDRALGRLPKQWGFLYPAMGVTRFAAKRLAGSMKSRTEGDD